GRDLRVGSFWLHLANIPEVTTMVRSPCCKIEEVSISLANNTILVNMFEATVTANHVNEEGKPELLAAFYSLVLHVSSSSKASAKRSGGPTSGGRRRGRSRGSPEGRFR